MSKDSSSGATSPSRGISHAQWLRKTFSSDDGAGGSSGDVWPDLLVDRRSVAERRSVQTLSFDTLTIERNNIVSIR